MDMLEAAEKIKQVENGLKLALLVVGGLAGAIALVALITASQVKKIEEDIPA